MWKDAIRSDDSDAVGSDTIAALTKSKTTNAIPQTPAARLVPKKLVKTEARPARARLAPPPRRGSGAVPGSSRRPPRRRPVAGARAHARRKARRAVAARARSAPPPDRRHEVERRAPHRRSTFPRRKLVGRRNLHPGTAPRRWHRRPREQFDGAVRRAFGRPSRRSPPPPGSRETASGVRDLWLL